MEEQNDNRKAARLAAYMVVQEDKRKESERAKQDMARAKR